MNNKTSAVTDSRTVASVPQTYRFSRKRVRILEGDCEAFLNVKDRETLEKQIDGQWHVWSDVNGGWQ